MYVFMFYLLYVCLSSKMNSILIASFVALQWSCLVLGICSTNVSFAQKQPQLFVKYGWGQLEFDWQSQSQRQEYISSGKYIPGISAPIDADVYYSPHGNQYNKIFVTIPRFQKGVPIGLGTITNKNYHGNPIITPYPDWSWHLNSEQCNVNRIVSVYRIKIDECGRLWVLDNGRLVDTIICPPQILVFDLKTNKLLSSYEIPRSQYEKRSIFVTPIVDVRNQCRDTFVYAADCQANALVVYDYNNGNSWRVTDKTFYPYPDYGTYNILGHSFDLMDGILGMDLEPLNRGDRKLFYQAMSSPTLNWVYTSDLKNQSRFASDSGSSPQIFHTYRARRDTQSAAMAIDKDGISYSGLMSEVQLICWNTQAPEYGPKFWEVVANNKETLQFISGIKVINNYKKNYQELWAVTSRFQRVADGSIDVNDVNFRILVEKVDDITFSTRCKKRGPSGPPGGGYGLFRP
ncbi:unnamed protein product [Brassicogethes aeneus]|uniref:Uncharacterized protein n=1 Tax=Brassicogethes aeneus TaxID=1431903 RepID=A0A9P0BIR5_BRAAE|nr:unnamed protein product [Brassicogethes aeneus]